MTSTLAKLADRYLRDVSDQANACYEPSRKRGTYPSGTTQGLSRAERAMTFALPEKVANLASGYVASLRPDAPASQHVIADHIKRMITTFDVLSERRQPVDHIETIDCWIGQHVRISGIVSAIRATEMYPDHHQITPGNDGIPYGLQGTYLGYTHKPGAVTVYLSAGNEFMAADLLLPAVASLYVPTQVVRTIPLR